MLKSTAIAVFLTVSVTTAAAVDMVSLFVTSDGFASKTETSAIAYNQNTDQNNLSHPDGLQMMVATENVAVKQDTAKGDQPVIDATNYVGWKNIYRA